MSDNIIQDKSFRFAVDTVNIYKKLISKNEFVLSKQLLKAGTSVGANVREAMDGQSKKDFLSKMNIALKEIKEVEYWIELLIETSHLDIAEHGWYFEKCKEICRLLNAIVKSTKKSLGL
jgi:four helix bundle protein